METAVGNDGTMSSMSTTSRTTNDSWDGLFRRSQNLGDRIECLLQEYESLAQRLNAVFVDEENPLVESGEEERLSMAIHSELDELMHCIQDMKARPSLSRAQQTRVSRFYEIHFDHSREWQKISETIQRKRDSLQAVRAGHDHIDPSMRLLLQDQAHVGASVRDFYGMISQAVDSHTAAARRELASSGVQVPLSRASRFCGIKTLLLFCFAFFVLWWFVSARSSSQLDSTN